MKAPMLPTKPGFEMESSPATQAFPKHVSYLLSELSARIELNPSYSLRSFARNLSLSAATLSGVLSCKRPLTLSSAKKITSNLNWTESKIESFLKSVSEFYLKTQGEKRTESKSIGSGLQTRDKYQSYHLLSEDVFNAISSWYHFAILEILETIYFNQKYPSNLEKEKFLAKTFGCTRIEIRSAVERLKRLGLIIVKDSQWVKSKNFISTGSEIPSAAIRKRHQQILAQALNSLQRDSVLERDFSSITFAIDPKLLPKAKEKIKKFRRSMNKFFESGEKTRVYEIAIQLFPLQMRLK
jgi:uncharacterized protein (TIGR02147 family)